VKHSGKVWSSKTAAAGNSTQASANAAMLGEAGPMRGATKALLMVKYAADKQQGELSLLLKEGENPNVKEKVTWQQFPTTPLFEGAVNGYKRIVRMLVEHGAKLDTVVGPNWTPVYNASLNGHDECVQLLCEAGADVTIATDDKMTPLYVAAQGGFADSVTAILESKTMTQAAKDYAPAELNGATALYVACQNGHVKVVHALLEHGVTVDPQMHACGSTPLHISMFLAERDADVPHIKLCEMLFGKGASLDIKNRAGKNVLDLANDDNSLIKMVEDERDRRAGKWGVW
jgi:ankyrin repeat protein